MQLTIREPGSAITHFIGCLMALIAASPLLIKAHGNATYMLAMTIFATSMVLLYHILARAQVAVSPQFFGWLAGLSTHIRVISPDSVVNEYQIFLQEILHSYTDMQ